MAFVLRKAARPGDPIDPHRADAPHAPGASMSPQLPGQVPDRSGVPEHGQLPVAPPQGEVRLPLTEYGTAQRIMGVYETKPETGNDMDPARFEQATVSYEEMRKADPRLRTPMRPAAGWALADGARVASPGLAALSEAIDTTGADQ